MENFITIKENVIAEITEKKSKFIANLIKVENKQDAEEKINKIKKTYHDARHNCVAYRIIEENKIIEKSSDDGEPSGTAGGPMLNILQKNNLCNILVIVTRYFGGILLGTGGLVRAYSETTQKAIENAQKIEMILGTEMEAKVEYSEYEKFKYYCQKNQIKIEKVEYNEKINCKIALENKVKQDKMVAQYQEMVNSMEAQVNEIKTQVDVLKQKLEEARSKQAMLVARSRMADAKSQMAKTLGGMDSKSAFAKMDKMEEKISQKESQADAFSEVSGIQESESDPFAQMDKENSINAELEKLKNEMNNNN